MIKKLLFTSFFFISIIGSLYPTKKENTNLFDYCFSLEKILVRNSFKNRKNVSGEINYLTKKIASFGIDNSRGDLTKRIINKYKTSEDALLISFVPTKIYCLSGYWIENFRPGSLEAIIYESSKEVIEEYYDEYERILKNDINDLINNFNENYKILRKDLNEIFD